MMFSGLKKIQLISLVLAAVMVWQYAGGRTYAALSQVQLPASLRPERDSRLANGLAESHFDALLTELREVIRDGGAKTTGAPEKGFAGIERLNTIKDKLATEDEKNQQYFSQLEETIAEKKLPAEIRARHAEFVQQYQSKYDALIEHLEGLESAHKTATGLWGKLTGQSQNVNWRQVIEKTTAFLDANTPQPRPRQRIDPHNLPHRSLKAEQPIAPKLTRAEWLKAFPKEASPSGPTSGPRAGAKTGDTHSPLATTPPTPADLAETIEVKFTPDIRQLADSLDRNPVKIYNWVRNNIEFIPVWGSIQGAQLCLETRSCNAFDTSSLLISLLRHSGVPARYQMGTIEVPIEKFKNWAGGFTSVDAAASLFASGGIPSIARRVNQSNEVVSMRLEHAWVKAFVDYAPSAGNSNHLGDTWVELDSSFKQYSFTEAIDFETEVPSNAQAFIDQLLSEATTDPVTGSVTNVNTEAMGTFVGQLGDRRMSYLRTNLPNARLGEIFGAQVIVKIEPPLLVAALPYRVLARANETSLIPDNLRHKVTFSLGSDSQVPTAANLINFTASLPELAGENILLVYAPASQADEQLLHSLASRFLPTNPTIFPSLIRFFPRLYVGKQLAASGGSLSAGSPVVLQITFSAPTLSTPPIINAKVAGEATAIGLDLQGVPQAQADRLAQNVRAMSDRLRQGNVSGLTTQDFAEAILSSSIVSWFALTDVTYKVMARGHGVVSVRYPSAGLFFIRQEVHTLFGAPVSISPKGVNMDVDRDFVLNFARDGDTAHAAEVTLHQGISGSAKEAEVPVSTLSSPNIPFGGVATVQALKLANDQGIPVYNIKPANASLIIPQLQIDQRELADIEDAINAGLEVTVSKSPANFNGRGVLGIAILNPLDGSGSFLISGGFNGSMNDPQSCQTATPASTNPAKLSLARSSSCNPLVVIDYFFFVTLLAGIGLALILAIVGVEAFIIGVLLGVLAAVAIAILAIIEVIIALLISALLGVSFCDVLFLLLDITCAIGLELLFPGRFILGLLFCSVTLGLIGLLTCSRNPPTAQARIRRRFFENRLSPSLVS